MAIFIASTKSISRGKGQSAVASASYRAGEKLYDERHGKTHNYESRKRQNDVLSADIIMPENLKELSISRAELWNLAEKSEKRKDARVGREWLINLPHELNEQNRKELAHTFAKKLVERYGVIADCAIHRPSEKEVERGADPRNFHAHILLTTRQAELKNGQIVLDKKADSELSDNDRKKKGLPRMNEEITQIRELWETLANEKLAEHNLELIDRRSYEELRIDRLPQIKMGAGATALERNGKPTEKGNINRAITEYNELVFKRELEYIEQTNSRAEQIIFESRKQNDERELRDKRIQFANRIALQADKLIAKRTDSEQHIRTSEQIIDTAESRIADTQRKIEQRAGAEESTADFYYRQFEEYVAQHRNSESRIERTQRIIDRTESFTSESATFHRARESRIERRQSAVNNSERIIAESSQAINARAERQRLAEEQTQREQKAELERLEQERQRQQELKRQAELERQRLAEQERLEREQAEIERRERLEQQEQLAEQARLEREQAEIERRERLEQQEQLAEQARLERERLAKLEKGLPELLKQLRNYSHKSSELVSDVSNLIKDNMLCVNGVDFPVALRSKICLAAGSKTLFEISQDGRTGIRKKSYSNELDYYKTSDIFELGNNELKIKHANSSYPLSMFDDYEMRDILNSFENSKNWEYETPTPSPITTGTANEYKNEHKNEYKNNNDFRMGF